MNRIRASLTYALNGLVFAALAGVGIWGHHTHWKVPKFSEVAGSVGDGEAQDTALPAGSSDGIPDPVTFDSPEAVRQAGIELAEVVRRPLDHHFTASAVSAYDPRRVAKLSVRVPGHVWSVQSRVGDKVCKGQILAVVDAEEVGRAKAEFLRAGMDCAFKTRHLARLRAASRNGAISDQIVYEAETALNAAHVACFNSQQKLLNLGLPVNFDEKVSISPEELSRQIQFLGIPPELVERTNPRPKTANLIPITAPLDGVVTVADLVVGELVGPDRPQFVVADLRHMVVRLSVRKEDSLALKLGQTVRFHGDGVPTEVEGRVTWIGTEIDEKTRTVQAWAEVGNESGGETRGILRAGMFGSAIVTTAVEPDAILVPTTAVQRLETTPLVFVAAADGCTFLPRRVRLGTASGTRTQILEGVQPGERVAAEGSFILKSELLKDSLVAD